MRIGVLLSDGYLYSLGPPTFGRSCEADWLRYCCSSESQFLSHDTFCAEVTSSLASKPHFKYLLCTVLRYEGHKPAATVRRNFEDGFCCKSRLSLKPAPAPRRQSLEYPVALAPQLGRNMSRTHAPVMRWGMTTSSSLVLDIDG